jgi:hypothetical protein
MLGLPVVRVLVLALDDEAGADDGDDDVPGVDALGDDVLLQAARAVTTPQASAANTHLLRLVGSFMVPCPP